MRKGVGEKEGQGLQLYVCLNTHTCVRTHNGVGGGVDDRQTEANPEIAK